MSPRTGLSQATAQAAERADVDHLVWPGTEGTQRSSLAAARFTNNLLFANHDTPIAFPERLQRCVPMDVSMPVESLVGVLLVVSFALAGGLVCFLSAA